MDVKRKKGGKRKKGEEIICLGVSMKLSGLLELKLWLLGLCKPSPELPKHDIESVHVQLDWVWL